MIYGHLFATGRSRATNDSDTAEKFESRFQELQEAKPAEFHDDMCTANNKLDIPQWCAAQSY